MISPEFNAFLDRLSGYLRLSRSQRDAIRVELEDHIESQLADLTAGGMPYDDAMSKVLDEFGDAADLATRFSRIGQKRRWIMRSVIAASVVTAATLVTSFLMPPQPGNPLAPGYINAANSGAANTAAIEPVPSAVVMPNPNDDAVRAALERQLPELKLDGVSFEDALNHFQTLADVNIVVDWQALEFEGVERDKEVSLTLKDVNIGKALQLVLEIAGGPDGDLDHQVDDGVLRISTHGELYKRTEVRLYNCTDLLKRESPRWLADEIERALDRIRNYKSSEPVRLQVMSDLLETVSRRRVEELRKVILSSVDPDSWRETGGDAGSITVFDDILVIVQTADNHDAIGRLLDTLNSVRMASATSRSQ